MSAWANPLQLLRRGILGMNARNVRYIGRYNDRVHYPAVDDKLKTKVLAVRAGVPVPALLGVISTQREIEHGAETLLDFREFVIKPAHGSGGKGILVVVDRDGDAFVLSNGSSIRIDDVKRHLSNILSGLHSLGGRTDVAIVEALVQSTDAFREISVEGVPDVRLIVFRGYPVMTMLRLATRASDGKANLHQGAIGVGLDVGSGRSIAAVQHNRPISRHPDTGHALDHIEVPHWHDVLRLAASCYEVTQLGYLGADVVLDRSRGPMLLELNARPGLSIQIANAAGLLPRLREIERLETIDSRIESRVDFAIRAFSRTDRQQSLWPERSTTGIDQLVETNSSEGAGALASGGYATDSN